MVRVFKEYASGRGGKSDKYQTIYEYVHDVKILNEAYEYLPMAQYNHHTMRLLNVR